MSGAFEGFWVIIAITLLGYAAARGGALDDSAQSALARAAFYVASPCLLLTVLAKAPVREVLSRPLLVALGSVVITLIVYLTVAVRRWPQDLGGTVIACLGAAYVNAANLGIPVATYVLGDAALVAPTLLLQLCLLTPVAMTLMDVDALGHRPGPARVVGGVLRNPLTLASLGGVVLAVTGRYPPAAVMRPVEVVGQMAVPAMLVAFGVSLHHGPRPGASGRLAEIGWITVCKLAVQPLAALALGLAAGLTGRVLLAGVVVAALPTAQNVFTHAVRYGREVALARDAVLVTTLVSAPVVLLLGVLGHAG